MSTNDELNGKGWADKVGGGRGVSLAAYRDPLITSTWVQQVGRDFLQVYPNTSYRRDPSTREAMPTGSVRVNRSGLPGHQRLRAWSAIRRARWAARSASERQSMEAERAVSRLRPRMTAELRTECHRGKCAANDLGGALPRTQDQASTGM